MIEEGFENIWMIKVPKRNEQGMDMVIMATEMHGWRDTLDEDETVQVKELFAESVAGRSYIGLGTIHQFNVEDLQPIFIALHDPQEMLECPIVARKS